MTGGVLYRVLYFLVRIAFFVWHPVYRVIGRKHVPKSGRLMICPNHSGMADPLWAVMSMNLGHIPRIYAKKEAMNYPVIGWILEHFGVIGIDRDIADVSAIKEGLRALRDEQQLLIFPEGTRVRERSKSNPKRGAVTLAARTDTPILPVYISMRKYPFQPVKVVFGEPYRLTFAGKRATDEELDQATQELMKKIYALEDCI